MRSASSAARSCRREALLLLALLSLSGVTGGGPAPGPHPAQAAPWIAATTPPALAVNITAADPLSVEFSEPMNQTSVTATVTEVGTGTNVPVLTSWPNTTTLQVTAAAPGLANCTIYAVRIGGNDLDDNLTLVAGPVPNPWRFMTACGRPYILRTVPADGARNVAPDADIVVTFSEAMYPLVSQPITFVPSVPGGWNGSFDAATGTIFTFHPGPGTRFVSGTTYTATANAAFESNDTREALVPSLTPNPWTFTVNAPPSVTAPTLSASGCLDAGTDLTVSWTMNDTEDNASALSVRLLYWNASRWDLFRSGTGFPSSASVVWTLPPLNADTRVRVEVTDTAGATSANESAAFRIDTGPPSILGTNPSDGAADVRTDANFTITFSEPMNQTTTEAAISLTPSYPLRFEWLQGNATIRVRPGSLPDRTPFLLTIAGTATDTCYPGRPMGADVEVRFRTGKVPAFPPAWIRTNGVEESAATLEWAAVTTFESGSPIPAGANITYYLWRQNGTAPATLVAMTGGTSDRDTGLRPDTDYVYWVVAVVDGEVSRRSSLQLVHTLPPFFTRTEGRVALLALFVAVGIATAAGVQVRRKRKKEEAEAALTAEIQDVVARVRKVRTEPNVEARRKEEEALQEHFRGLVEGEEAADSRLEGLYRALAQVLVRSPEVDIARGRKVVDAQLGDLAPKLHQAGAAYRLLSEAEASVRSDLFPTLPASARKALLLVYFYALEEYLGQRLRGLIPTGATILLGERGHINVRRRGWEAQWAGLTLGNLLFAMDHNTHFFVADLETWEKEVEPLLKDAVDARNKTAHPSKEAPPLERVRGLVYRAIPAVESILKWPKGPVAG